MEHGRATLKAGALTSKPIRKGNDLGNFNSNRLSQSQQVLICQLTTGCRPSWGSTSAYLIPHVFSKIFQPPMILSQFHGRGYGVTNDWTNNPLIIVCFDDISPALVTDRDSSSLYVLISLSRTIVLYLCLMVDILWFKPLLYVLLWLFSRLLRSLNALGRTVYICISPWLDQYIAVLSISVSFLSRRVLDTLDW